MRGWRLRQRSSQYKGISSRAPCWGCGAGRAEGLRLRGGGWRCSGRATVATGQQESPDSPGGQSPEKSGSGGSLGGRAGGPDVAGITNAARLESFRRWEGGCSTKGPQSHHAGLVGAEPRALGSPGASRLSELARLCFRAVR